MKDIGEKRDRRTGQYVHTNDAMCTCGHTLGLHAAATVGGKRPCFAGDDGSVNCDCEKFRRARPIQGKHGLSYTPEYRAWQQMRLRCLNPEHAAYARYGGRGITICQRWLDSVDAFVADMGPRPDGHELDRRDNNGPYSPENCRWVTRKVNDRNRESNRIVEYAGERFTVAEWSEITGVAMDTLTWRLARWPLDKAMRTATKRRGPVRGAKAARRAASR